MREIINISTKSYEVMVPVRIDIVETLDGYQAWGYMEVSPDDGKELLFEAGSDEMSYGEFQNYVEANLPGCVSLFNDELFDDDEFDFDDEDLD